MSFLKKEISTTKGLIAIFGAAVVLFGGAFTYYYRTAPTTYDYEIQGSTVVKKAATSATTDETKDWKTYTNSKYGFQLTLNDAFKDYKSQEIPSTSFQTSFILFNLPTTDSNVKENAALGGKYADIFNIVVYTPSQWAEVEKAADTDTKELKANSIYITKNSNYVFIYTINKKIPADLASKDYKVADVIKTFKLTSDDSTADWQTYKNDTYGFSFKYPKDWSKSDGSKDASVSFLSKEMSDAVKSLKNAGAPTPDFMVRTMKETNYLKDMNWAQGTGSDAINFIKSSKEFKNIIDVKLSDQTAVMADTDYYQEQTNVVSVANGFAYEVTMRGLQAALTNTQKKILSTFQFTK